VEMVDSRVMATEGANRKAAVKMVIRFLLRLLFVLTLSL